MKRTFLLLISIVPVFLFSQTDTLISQEIDYLNIAREIISEAEFCSLVTTNKLNQSSIRIMDPFPPEDDLSIYFGTNPKSRKVQHIRQNSNVCLLYFDTANYGYVTLYGHASIVDSNALKEKYWKEQWTDFYPHYPEDYGIIQFIPDSLEIISPHHGISGDEDTWKSPIYLLNKK